MADKKIFIADGPHKGKTPRAPFDLTFTSNITGKFGEVQCVMMKYYPPGTKLRIQPNFAYDLMPFVYPIQTNVRCHVELYKIPLRILCKDFEDFTCQLGQDGTPVNTGSFPFVLPYIKRPSGWNGKGTFAEQIGCSNMKISESDSLEELPLKHSIGNIYSNNEFVPIPAGTSSSSNLFVNISLPRSSVPKLVPSNTFTNGLSVALYYVNNTSSTTSASGSFRFHIIHHRQDTHIVSNGTHPYSYHVVYSSPAFTKLVNTSSAFNSSTSSAVFYGSTTQKTINGNICYEHPVYLKNIDDTFYQKYAFYRALGFKISILIEISGSTLSNFYYTADDYDGLKIETVTTRYGTKIDDTTGDVTSQQEQSTFFKQLGISNHCLFGITTFTEDTHTLWDSVDGADPVQPAPAMPFRALEFIHNYFKRKPRIDPFLKDGVPSYNKFLTNDGSGPDTTTPVDSWNAFYEDDYFTTCVKEPQFGNAPLVGVTVNDTSDTGILTFKDDSSFDNYEVKLDIDQEGHVLPLTAYNDNANRPNVHRLQELISFGISINDLRNVSTFQRMLERMQRSVTAGGSAYANYIYEFFGTNPPIGDHYPQYLGGITRNLQVDKITNVAKSDSAALGEFAGQGRFRGEGKTIKCFLTEPSYIVAIQYFTVTPCYSQYAPKHLFYKDPLDFYLNPDFATVAPQPVYAKELAISNLNSENLNDVFGYNRPYAELVSNVDEVHGNFRTDMSNFLLQRVFGSKPQLNKSFIEVNSADLLNIFSVTEDTDKIYGQVMFKIHGSLPLPRSYTPHTI